MKDFLGIETKTTGFSSPAVDYTEKRLEIPGLEIKDPYFTFFFRVGKTINFPTLKSGDVLVVSRSKEIQNGDVCLGINNKGEFSLYRMGNGIPEEHWGVVLKVVRNV